MPSARDTMWKWPPRGGSTPRPAPPPAGQVSALPRRRLATASADGLGWYPRLRQWRAGLPTTYSAIVACVQPPASTLAVATRAWQRVAALEIAVAWGVLGYGLFGSTANQRAWDDLEAGGRFAVNLVVYLPFLTLSFPIAIGVVLGLFSSLRSLSPLVATTVVIAVFASWVATRQDLLHAQPQLSRFLVLCLVIDAAAAVVVTYAWLAATRSDGTSWSR